MTQKAILFSVLIANYDNGRFIAEALESIFAQTYTNWEIIIVDDASTDDSIKIIKPFLADKRIKLYQNDANNGCGFTKRRCIELASGEICGFLDPDDALTPNAIEMMIKEHELHPDLSLINSALYYCNSLLKITRVGTNNKPVPNGGPYLLYNDGSVSAFASFKKRLYLKTEGLNPLYKKAVDQDLYLLLDEVGKMGYINIPLYFYRIHEEGISTFKNVKAAHLQHLAIIIKACRKRLGTTIEKDQIKEFKKVLYKSSFMEAVVKHAWFDIAKFTAIYILFGGGKDIIKVFKNSLMLRIKSIRFTY